VPHSGVPFLGITTLHLPSHLAKSRHGVFYFRLTFKTGGVTKEKRISLLTKNPQYLSGIMAVHQIGGLSMCNINSDEI
jgi:hypothetical protein